MAALTSPAGRHSWELLYRQPHPAWPDALTKVAIMGVLTQALVKIPEPEMTQFATRWLNEARQNFAHIERDLHIKPQWAMFTSWTKFPGHAVTDENGLGEDYLVKEYLKGVGSR